MIIRHVRFFSNHEFLPCRVRLAWPFSPKESVEAGTSILFGKVRFLKRVLERIAPGQGSVFLHFDGARCKD